MSNNPSRLPRAVEEAMDTVYCPGLWENRDGEIFVGIKGGGSALSPDVIKEQLEAWQVLAKHYGIVE